jgi:hypothetical protein
MIRTVLACALILISSASIAQTPYAGLQARQIKSLSEQQVADLKAGRGMGMALASKWKKQGFVADLPTGPKQPKSTAPSIEDEARSALPFADTRYCSERLIGSTRRECVDHIIDSGSRYV